MIGWRGNMNEKVFHTLEYNKIRTYLAEYAFCEEAKKRCLSLVPITDKEEIELLQLQTKDALFFAAFHNRFDNSPRQES